MDLLFFVLLAFAQTRCTEGVQDKEDAKRVIDDTPVTVTVIQSATAILPCSVHQSYTEGSKDMYKVVWVSPAQTAISIEDRRVINDMRISVERTFVWDWNLHIRNVSITDAGTYMCQINTMPVKTKRVHLVVQVPPSFVEYTRPQEIHKNEGEQVELFCNATGIPAPVVTWWRQNYYTSGTRERVGELPGERLVIRNITRMCADYYVCIADNNVPPATKQEFRVDVDYPPEIKLHNNRIGQEVGKETILECVISASPLGVSVWRRNSEALNKHPNKGKYEVNIYDVASELNTIVMSLRIVRVEMEDYGSYACEALNKLGKVSKNMELYQIEPKLPPTTTTTTPATTTTTTTTAKEKFVLADPDNRPTGFGGGKNPDVIFNGQELANRNGYPPRGGTYGSTPEVKPSGMHGPESNVYDKSSSGISGSADFFYLYVLSLCVASSLWFKDYLV
ncbi:limbic system-associated membrane protein-like [Pomacea canaliculata]|uniref:limbic system-associated membrane protein-like n=1 Tax=Pomacea canaliculata TaxID=400727 RepID=UPI000D734481|nr:limbic system-associated membrane protein-like [Pomacea canaliculata]